MSPAASAECRQPSDGAHLQAGADHRVDRPGAFAEYISTPSRTPVTDQRFAPETANDSGNPWQRRSHRVGCPPPDQWWRFRSRATGLFAVPDCARHCGLPKSSQSSPATSKRSWGLQDGLDVVITVTLSVDSRESGGEGRRAGSRCPGTAGNRTGPVSLRHGGHVRQVLGIPSRPMEVDRRWQFPPWQGSNGLGHSGPPIWETWYQTRGFLESGMGSLPPSSPTNFRSQEFALAFEPRRVRAGQSFCGRARVKPTRPCSEHGGNAMAELSFAEDELEQPGRSAPSGSLWDLESSQSASQCSTADLYTPSSSNNYLGLTTHPRLRRRHSRQLATGGAGSGLVRNHRGHDGSSRAARKGSSRTKNNGGGALPFSPVSLAIPESHPLSSLRTVT